MERQIVSSFLRRDTWAAAADLRLSEPLAAMPTGFVVR